ncbi:MAG: class I SAM-dependent methyltransferase, partial [Neisseria sp.]
RFLNLFSYTGSFTVYAATGGAVSSETVDLSNTYLEWAKRNFELNGIDLEQHKIVRADVFQYLQNAADEGKKFDLIVMDPPSFSNSKKMLDILDIQRDHKKLIDGAMSLLASDGILYFSNNLRSFVLDDSVAEQYTVKDISKQSVPDDFRNKKIHQCWEIKHK